jgi:uncharacterized protein DUF5818
MRCGIMVAVVLVAAVVGCKEDLPAKLDPEQTVTVSGEVATGTECPMLIVKPERRFSLSGSLGRFKVGDRVCVHGTVAQMSMCMAGEATIAIVSIAPEDSCP